MHPLLCETTILLTFQDGFGIIGISRSNGGEMTSATAERRIITRAARRLVRQDLQLLPGAIEEILRYESPVQVHTRVAAQDLDLGVQQIPAPPTTPITSISAASPPTTWPLARAPTTVWGRPWPGSRAASRWRSS
jgi:hypothetical protein